MNSITHSYKELCNIIYKDFLKNMGYSKLENGYERNRFGVRKAVRIELLELPDSKHMIILLVSISFTNYEFIKKNRYRGIVSCINTPKRG